MPPHGPPRWCTCHPPAPTRSRGPGAEENHAGKRSTGQEDAPRARARKATAAAAASAAEAARLHIGAVAQADATAKKAEGELAIAKATVAAKQKEAEAAKIQAEAAKAQAEAQVGQNKMMMDMMAMFLQQQQRQQGPYQRVSAARLRKKRPVRPWCPMQGGVRRTERGGEAARGGQRTFMTGVFL